MDDTHTLLSRNKDLDSIKLSTKTAIRAAFCASTFNGGRIRICSLHHKEANPYSTILSCKVSEIELYTDMLWDFLFMNEEERAEFLKEHKEFEQKISYFLSHRGKQLKLNPYTDLYISANAFIGNRQYTTENVFSLHNIVIDIDAHNGMDANKIVENGKALYREIETALGFYGVYPTVINFTGRGMQLWFSFIPVSAKLEKCYKEVCLSLKNIIEECISAHPECGFDKIDSKASFKRAGLYRLFGSYNSRAMLNNTFGAFGEAVADQNPHIKKLNDIRSTLAFEVVASACEPSERQMQVIDTINDTIGTEFSPKNRREACDFIKDNINESYQIAYGKEYSTKKKKKTKKITKKCEYTPLFKYRKEIIEYKVSLYNNGAEGRHNKLFQYLNALVQMMELDDAIKLTEELNQKFRHPLEDLSYLKTQFKRRIGDNGIIAYKFSQDKFHEEIDITPAEIKEFVRLRRKTRPKKKKVTPQYKKMEKVFEYCQQNLIVAEIHRRIINSEDFNGKCSKTTLAKYVNAFKTFLTEYENDYQYRIKDDEFKQGIQEYNNKTKISNFKKQIYRDAFDVIYANKGKWERTMLPYLCNEAEELQKLVEGELSEKDCEEPTKVLKGNGIKGVGRTALKAFPSAPQGRKKTYTIDTKNGFIQLGNYDDISYTPNFKDVIIKYRKTDDIDVLSHSRKKATDKYYQIPPPYP